MFSAVVGGNYVYGLFSERWRLRRLCNDGPPLAVGPGQTCTSEPSGVSESTCGTLVEWVLALPRAALLCLAGGVLFCGMDRRVRITSVCRVELCMTDTITHTDEKVR